MPLGDVIINPWISASAGPWDLFVSAYEQTERVQSPFDNVEAKCRQWFAQREYDMPMEGFPQDALILDAAYDSPAIEFVRRANSSTPRYEVVYRLYWIYPASFIGAPESRKGSRAPNVRRSL